MTPIRPIELCNPKPSDYNKEIAKKTILTDNKDMIRIWSSFLGIRDVLKLSLVNRSFRYNEIIVIAHKAKANTDFSNSDSPENMVQSAQKKFTPQFYEQLQIIWKTFFISQNKSYLDGHPGAPFPVNYKKVAYQLDELQLPLASRYVFVQAVKKDYAELVDLIAKQNPEVVDYTVHEDCTRSLMVGRIANTVLGRNINTPLDYAIQEGKIKVVQVLIENGSDVNRVYDPETPNALFLAVSTDHAKVDDRAKADIMMSLLNARRDLCNCVTASRQTVLMRSIQYAFKRKDYCVKLLIAHSYNMNQCDNQGKTALMYAVTDGHLNIVRQLVKARANVNSQDSFGETILMRAVAKGHIKTVKFLLGSRAQINQVSRTGATALMVAVSCKTPKIQLVKFLIAEGANRHVTDNDGNSLLFHVCSNDKDNVHVRCGIIKILIDAGCAVDKILNEDRLSDCYRKKIIKVLDAQSNMTHDAPTVPAHKVEAITEFPNSGSLENMVTPQLYEQSPPTSANSIAANSVTPDNPTCTETLQVPAPSDLENLATTSAKVPDKAPDAPGSVKSITARAGEFLLSMGYKALNLALRIARWFHAQF